MVHASFHGLRVWVWRRQSGLLDFGLATSQEVVGCEPAESPDMAAKKVADPLEQSLGMADRAESQRGNEHG